MNDTEQRVKAFIERQQLLEKDKRYLVALSGGADSVCLFLLLKKLGYQVEAVHCNFNLRGEESLRDEQFVKSLASSRDVELHLAHFDTKAYAALHCVSIEMAARRLRYRYFEQLRQDIGAEAVCVAHHKDDSAETVLMNLVRGTGIRGLTGIKPRNGNIVRPLLCLSRNDIESWLKSQGQDYVTDSTNLVPNIVRNNLRLVVLPALQTTTPTAADSILITARRLNEALKVYEHAVRASLGRLLENNSIAIEQLLKEPSPESLLFEWLTPLGFTAPTVEELTHRLQQALPGSEWTSATHQLTISRGRLVVEPIQALPPTLRLPEPGTYIYGTSQKITLRLLPGKHISKEQHTCCLDADKTAFPLTLRPCTTGDRFQPLGMKGSRLVSDFLTDRHFNVFEKRRTLVLTNAKGQIVWLAGLRPDHRFRITDETKQTLIVELTGENDIKQ